MIGFRTEQPTYTTPYSEGIFWVTMFCLLGAPIIGWILNLIAMKFYPLTKEKMASIQERIAEIKAEQTNV
jgi:Na+/melibiose symporter-like transporter